MHCDQQTGYVLLSLLSVGLVMRLGMVVNDSYLCALGSAAVMETIISFYQKNLMFHHRYAVGVWL